MQTAHYREVRIYSPARPKHVYTAPVERLQGAQAKHAGLKLRVSRHSLDVQ